MATTEADRKLQANIRSLGTAIDAVLNPGLKENAPRYSFVLMIAKTTDAQSMGYNTPTMYVCSGTKNEAAILAKSLLVRLNTMPSATNVNE